MTETFSTARCHKCGTTVGFEDGVRQDACSCDPECDVCGRQFVPAFSRYVCDDCIEKDIVKAFSREFLNTLTRKQSHLLTRDFAKRYE